MIQLRYLIDAEVDLSTKQKQANGKSISTYSKVEDYKVQIQELTDEVSAQIYGADVVRMLRVSSPFHALEEFLYSKVNNSSDNISLYTLLINGFRYKVKVVRSHWVDIELI